MTIVLRCSQCHSRLTVPDEAVGASARCPHCDEVFEVDDNVQSDEPERQLWSPRKSGPQATQVTSSSANALDADPIQNQTPTASAPAEGANREGSLDSAAADGRWDPAWTSHIEPGLLDGATTFELAWQSLLAHLGYLVGAHSIALMIGLGFSYLVNQAKESGEIGLAYAIQVPLIAVQWFLLIGLTKITLATARGQAAKDFNELFSGGRVYFRVFVYMLAYTVMVFVGTLMLFLPGVYLACRFWPGVHFIVDRNVSVKEALQLSSDHTAGNFQATMVVGLYGMLAFAAGYLTLGVGLLFTYPLYSMLWTVAYLMITRQPIARPWMQRAE